MLNFLSGALLDRCSTLRRDSEWLRVAFHDPAARILCYCNGEPLIRGGVENPEPIMLNGSLNAEVDISRAIFLGVEDGAPVFAVDSPRSEDFHSGELPAGGVPTDFREIIALMSRPAGALLAYGRALLLWHARHPYCSLCGSPSAVAEGGHLRRCTNESCLAEHYPRTDPAVIMLVVSGEHCLIPPWTLDLGPWT
jgi:NAD+ diphosphatase